MKKKGQSELQGFVIMLAMVALGEMPDSNLFLAVKFCWSNHLIRKGLIEVILKIDLVHILKSHQTVLSLFLVILGYLRGFNKICHC